MRFVMHTQALHASTLIAQPTQEKKMTSSISLAMLSTSWVSCLPSGAASCDGYAVRRGGTAGMPLRVEPLPPTSSTLLLRLRFTMRRRCSTSDMESLALLLLATTGAVPLLPPGTVFIKPP